MIEVNDYVRTNKGVIGELIQETLSYPEPSEWILKANNNKIVIVECNDYPVKHSKQLIDLIENKDILKVRIDKTIMFFGIDESTSDTKYKEIIKSIENGECELLEILTHQQFEANCYKVGGE